MNIDVLPAVHAMKLVEYAEQTKKPTIKYRRVLEALRLRAVVESSAYNWQVQHMVYTDVLLRCTVLLHELQRHEQALQVAQRAQVWADDPNTTGNQRQFKRAVELQHLVAAQQYLRWYQKIRWKFWKSITV